MLYVPPPTRYDLKWRMFGIPVRVHPMFWLLAALLGWNSEMPKLTILVWMPCVLVSVVVHELGHALTARRFGGGQPQIVLHFMGLATSGALAQSRERIIHILAGPGAGLIVATISCACGLKAQGGALGVGRATSSAVRDSIIAVIIANYFLTWMIYQT